MRRSILLAVLAAGPLHAAAAPDGELVTLKSRASIAAAVPVPSREAPFRVARDPLPDFVPREERFGARARSACESATTDVCYDMAESRLVYRPARRYMPRLEGLSAESVSLRRDRIVLKYSFR